MQLVDILSAYYGMTREEFIALINGDDDKLYRFAYDFVYNNNAKIKI